jgi:4-amino-4-deoxy-L-arabinose transferase-like glycosyltransferase
MGIQIRHQFLIVVTAVFVFFTGLGAARLWDEDEPEFARVAREMMLRDDWVMPTYNFRLFPDKPALLYWLMIGSYNLFGVTEFAARFPSAVLAVGTALLTYHLGRRLFRPQVGLWAGLVMATNLMFAVIGRAATFDSTLVFVTTLSLLALVVTMGPGYWASGASSQALSGGAGAVKALDRFRAVLPRSWWSFAAMYVPLGLGMMVKGPVGMLVPVAAIGLFVLFTGAVKRAEPIAKSASLVTGPAPARFDTLDGCIVQFLRLGWRRLRILAADFPAATWAMRPLSLAAIVLAISLPWYVMVSIRSEGEFLKGFFLLHNGKYLMQPMDGHHGSILYFPLVLLLFFFPWTIALFLGAAKVAKRIREGTGSSFACILVATWSLTWIGLASLSGTKLPHYIAPAFPALAVIAGMWIADWITAVQATTVQQATAQRATAQHVAAAPQDWSEHLLAWGWNIMAAVGILILIALPILTKYFAPGTPNPSWLGLIVLAGAISGWLCQRWRQPAAAATSIVLTNATLFVCLFAVVAVPLSQQQTSVRMMNSIRRIGAESGTIGVCRIFLPGLLFYSDFDHPIIEVKKEADARELFGSNGKSVLITDVDGLEELGNLVPEEARVVERQRRFLKGSTLLLVEFEAPENDDAPASATASAAPSAPAANLK